MNDENNDRVIMNIMRGIETSTFYDEFWNYAQQPSKFQRARGDFFRQCVVKFTQGKDLRILDIGCGTGWAAIFLHQYGQYVGVDFSPKGISFAEKCFGHLGRFFVGTAENTRLGLPDESQFDVVVCSEVIEHIIDQEAFCRQLESLLFVGGLCILTTPNRYFFAVVKKRYGESFQPIENWLSPPQLKNLLTQYKFRVVKHQGLPFRNIKYGVRGWLVSQRLLRIANKVNFGTLYMRSLIFTSLYQCMAVQRLPE